MEKLKLFCDGVPFKFGDAFAVHPLFDTFATFDADTKEMIKIDESNFERLKQQRYDMMNEYLEREDGLFGMFLMIRKPDRFNLLYFVQDLLDEKEFNDLLSDTWTNTEFPHMYGVKFLISFFCKSKKELLMDREELVYYDNLPDMIDVYRGIQNIGSKKKTIKGLSWTLSKEKAVWFANRFHAKGDVYKSSIKKEYVYAYFNGRSEQEIVLNPYKLMRVIKDA